MGLMGALADAVLSAGGRAVGVLPVTLQQREIGHQGLHELHLVNSMHERKALMAQRADAFVALPGGFGTFDELFEIITWGQLGLHTKPIGLLDVGGYFQPLIAMVRRGVEDGFIPEAHERPFAVSASAGELLDRLAGRPDDADHGEVAAPHRGDVRRLSARASAARCGRAWRPPAVCTYEALGGMTGVPSGSTFGKRTQ